MKADVDSTGRLASSDGRARAWLAESPLGALADAPFRHLWAAQLLSNLGTMISRIALVLHFGQGAHSVPAVGALIVAESLPGVLTAFFSGALVDRLDKRRLLIAMDVARAALIAVAIAWPGAFVIYAITAASSICSAFFNPARAAALPLSIPSALLTRANAMDQATSTIVMIAGPAIATVLFLKAGLAVTLGVDALSFLLSAALLVSLRIRAVRDEAAAGTESTLAQIRDGWRYLTRHGIVLHLVGATAISLLCVGLWMPVAPAFFRTFLEAPPGVLGAQLALFGLGGALGSLAAPAVVQRWGRGPVFNTMLLGEALVMLVYSLTPILALSYAIIFCWGAVIPLMMVPYASLLQAEVDEAFLGRVFAVARQAEHLTTVVAIGAAVAMQVWIAPQYIFLAAAGAYVLLAAAAWRRPSGRALARSR